MPRRHKKKPTPGEKVRSLAGRFAALAAHGKVAIDCGAEFIAGLEAFSGGSLPAKSVPTKALFEVLEKAGAKSGLLSTGWIVTEQQSAERCHGLTEELLGDLLGGILAEFELR